MWSHLIISVLLLHFLQWLILMPSLRLKFLYFIPCELSFCCVSPLENFLDSFALFERADCIPCFSICVLLPLSSSWLTRGVILWATVDPTASSLEGRRRRLWFLCMVVLHNLLPSSWTLVSVKPQPPLTSEWVNKLCCIMGITPGVLSFIFILKASTLIPPLAFSYYSRWSNFMAHSWG